MFYHSVLTRGYFDKTNKQVFAHPGPGTDRGGEWADRDEATQSSLSSSLSSQ